LHSNEKFCKLIELKIKIPVQWAEAAITVHGVQRTNFLGTEFEIENLEVFLDATLGH
jgi:hypothetical protein